MVRNCRRRVRLVTPPGEAGRDVISGSLHYLLLLRAGDHRYWADHRLGLRSVRWRRAVKFASSVSSGIATAKLRPIRLPLQNCPRRALHIHIRLSIYVLSRCAHWLGSQRWSVMGIKQLGTRGGRATVAAYGTQPR